MNAGDEMVRGLGDVLDLHRYLGENSVGNVGCLGCAWNGPHARHHTAEQRRAFHRAHVADILAAHVLGLVAAGKAEALREAAEVTTAPMSLATRAWLRARADGLAGEAS